MNLRMSFSRYLCNLRNTSFVCHLIIVGTSDQCIAESNLTLTDITASYCIKDLSNSPPLQVYAPWCGHCQSLEPEYNLLAESLKNISSIVIAKMDGTKNEHERLNVISVLHLAEAFQPAIVVWIVKYSKAWVTLINVFPSRILIWRGSYVDDLFADWRIPHTSLLSCRRQERSARKFSFR